MNFGESGLGGAVGRGTSMSGTGGGEGMVGEGEGVIVGVGVCGAVTHVEEMVVVAEEGNGRGGGGGAKPSLLQKPKHNHAHSLTHIPVHTWHGSGQILLFDNGTPSETIHHKFTHKVMISTSITGLIADAMQHSYGLLWQSAHQTQAFTTTHIKQVKATPPLMSVPL